MASFRTMALITASSMFMEQLDSTIIATALPTMATEFGVSAPAMSVAMTSYILSLAIFIPASGKVADRFGEKPTFCCSIVIFALGSILCGLAENLPFLIASRLLQGLGGAMMVPVARLILMRNVPRSEFVSAMAWFSVPALIGPVLGPPVGGAIVTYFSWRWIFFVNIPISALGLILVIQFIDSGPKLSPRPFDWIGFVWSGISLSCLTFGLETLSRGFGSRSQTVFLLATGIAFGFFYIRHAFRHPDPILDLRLMRIQTFRVSLLAGSLTRIASGAYPFILPLLMQLGFGKSAAASGFITFMTAVGTVLMKAMAPSILRWAGFRRTLFWNSIISAGLIAICAGFRPVWPDWLICGILLPVGLSHALQYTAYGAIAYADISRERMGDATSFYGTFQQLMLSMGICVSAGVLQTSTILAGHQRPGLGEFSATLLTVAAIAVFAAPLCARLSKDAGAEITGRYRTA